MSQTQTDGKTAAAKFQGEIWGARARDWAELGEPTSNDLFENILSKIDTNGNSIKMLDIGCGAGTFCKMAFEKGIDVTGLDASKALLDIAEEKNPGITFIEGDMEYLPFEDNTFDVVTGLTSIQFASNRKNAIKEAYRVLKPGGKFYAAVWGMPQDCDATLMFNELKDLLPSPPPGTPHPVLLAEPGVFEKLIEDGGFRTGKRENVKVKWRFENESDMIRGMMSPGMVAIAVKNSGEEKTRKAIIRSQVQFKKPDGSYEQYNTLICVAGEKSKL